MPAFNYAMSCYNDILRKRGPHDENRNVDQEELQRYFDEYTGIYLVEELRTTPECVQAMPIIKKIRFLVLYPIKGSLTPGEEIETFIRGNCKSNKSYLQFWCPRLFRSADTAVRRPWDRGDTRGIIFVNNERFVKVGEGYQYPDGNWFSLVPGEHAERVLVGILREKGWLARTPEKEALSLRR